MRHLLLDLRYRCEYAAFRLVGGLFASLPVETASTLCGKLWRAIAPRTHRHERALRHLRAAFPDKPEAELDALARDMWDILGRTFAEFFHLDEIRANRVAVENPALLLTGEAGEKGFVACGAHQGNWEVSAMAVPRRPVELASVYQKIKNPYVDAFVLRRRASIYPGGLFEKGASTGRKLMRHLRNKGAVGLLADLRDNHGVVVPFFGRPAPSSTFPAVMARTMEVPIFLLCIVREPGVRFRVRFEPVETPRTDDRDADIRVITANLHAAIEASVRRHPEQWMWAHRRWG